MYHCMEVISQATNLFSDGLICSLLTKCITKSNCSIEITVQFYHTIYCCLHSILFRYICCLCSFTFSILYVSKLFIALVHSLARTVIKIYLISVRIMSLRNRNAYNANINYCMFLNKFISRRVFQFSTLERHVITTTHILFINFWPESRFSGWKIWTDVFS